MLLVVLSALLPTAILSAIQGATAFENARRLVTDRLRANASALAESERDPFIIARHALSFAAEQKAVREYTPDCSAVLATALRGAEGLINFLRTDSEGKAQCSVLPFDRGRDMSRDQWWIESRGKPGLVVSTPQIGSISKQPVLIMVRPLFKPDGSFDGTLSAGIGLKRLSLSLQNKQKGHLGRVFVVNRKGDPVLQIPSNTFTAIPDVALAQSEMRETRASDDSTWTYVAAPLFGDDLYVIYAEPNGSVMATQVAQMRFAIGLQLLTLLLTSLAIWLGAHWLILRWMHRLQGLTTRFASGDFTGERHAYAAAPKEVTELADRMHDMAEEIDRHQKQLQAALTIETALTREVHHRVKNNLQIVTSLLTLQSERLSDPLARDVVGQAKARIAALALIHRLLYEEQRGGEKGTINVCHLLTELCAQLRSANRDRTGIALECESSDSALSVDQAVPVALFTVEALTNAFRHAFVSGPGGTIHVGYSDQNGVAVLRISDNGSGFIADAARPQMGLDLMEAFATQLSGEMEVASSPAGAVLTLTFAVAEALHDAED